MPSAAFVSAAPLRLRFSSRVVGSIRRAALPAAASRAARSRVVATAGSPPPMETPAGALAVAEALGAAKAKMPTRKILILGILAGAYIAIAAALAVTVGGAMPAVATANPGLQKLVFGLVGVPFGLTMVLTAGGELFTGNTAIVTAAVLAGRASLGNLIRNWTASFIGNLIGSLLVVYLMTVSGVFSAGSIATVVAIAKAKTSMSFATAFARGIACNWLLCLGVWLASSARDFTGKFLAVLLPISAFVAMGFDHSIANMFLIPMGMRAGATAISVKALFVGNLLPVALGNIVGGAVLVAFMYNMAFGKSASRAPAAQAASSTAVAAPAANISEYELAVAREAWGAGLISIAKAYDNGGIDVARETASSVLDAAYGYNLGPVLFKPTLASGDKTFRPTKTGALSYFVGHNPDYPNDGGFAIKGWRHCESVTSASFVEGNVGLWMGWMIITDAKGQVTKVDKSFGYKKDANGTLRIVLHHSSLPYSPVAKSAPVAPAAPAVRSTAFAAPPANISDYELASAREAWGAGLISIAKAYDNDGIDVARETASSVLDAAYGYNLGPVLFKPTLASGDQTFRPNKTGALSYFVGHNPEYPNDGGFAIKGWRHCESVTSASFVEGNVGMWMGWMIITDAKGQVTKVDKSFGYKKDANGTLRIVLHHSSLPYSPDAKAAPAAPAAPAASSASISEFELAAAREAWGAGLISIAKAYENGGIDVARETASSVLDAAYGYNLGPVLFKPTLASGDQTFRPTKTGALSYFVGHNPDYPNDGGFAIKGWRHCESVTSACFVEGDVAMWMGWMIITDANGQVTKVDKSFGYKKDANGTLRIVLHHSSLPYSPGGKSAPLAPSAPAANISQSELAAAREAWGAGLISIAKAYDNDGIDVARETASSVLDAAYGYNLGPVLFKPTLASGDQTFRPDKTGALSYFVGHNPEYPNDGGFAIKGWRHCESVTSASFVEGNVGMWMGWMIITDAKGQVTKVDKSFGYKKDANGTLRIVLHHSSLPYSPVAKSAPVAPAAPAASSASISEFELAAAREAWGAGLISIAKAYENGGIDVARETASSVLDAAYGYDLGPVLFKPTLASGDQTFRPTKTGALSYFVGHNPEYPKDGGFAIKGWRHCQSVTSASFIQGDVAMWMGWMIITDANGQVTKVDKSFGYKKDANGTLRIVLHHSSLPYSP